MPTSRPRPLRLAAAFVAVLALGFAACGGDDDDANPSSASTVRSASFPVTVVADNGEVEIAAEPTRIVSLSPSLTELLFAVGAGDQVVAVDDSSDYPAGVPTTDLSGFRPNVEAIGGYEPDLVVVARDRDGLVDALNALDIPVLVLGRAAGLHDVYEQIDALGAATGHPQQAVALAQEIEADLAVIVASVPQREAPLDVFYELSDDLRSVTSDTFIGELLGLAGLRNIADGVDDAAGGFPQLSTEYVLDADPDVVLLAHTDGTGRDPAEVAARPGWAEVRAVRDGRVVVLPEDVASRWGPRVVDLLRAMVEASS